MSTTGTTGGARMNMDENALICRVLSGMIERGVMVDVGACHGSASVPMLRAGWRVEAFEPDQGKWGALEKLESQGLRLHKVAADEEDREGAAFFTSSESIGIASLLAFRESHVPAGVVPVRTLRTALAPLNLGRVDYLKIDAEGYDLRVLRGYPWSSLRPRAVLCEFEDRKTRALGYTMPEMAGYLADLGYEVWVSEWKPIERYGVQHAWRSIRRWPCGLEDAGAWGNLIAVEPGVVGQRFAIAVRGTLEAGRLASDAAVAALLPSGRISAAVERVRARAGGGAARVALLGAGAHTRAAFEADAGLAERVAVVIDEDAARWGQRLGAAGGAGESGAGVEVWGPEAIERLGIAALVPSSDAHHAALLTSAQRMAGVSAAVGRVVHVEAAYPATDASERLVVPVVTDAASLARIAAACAARYAEGTTTIVASAAALGGVGLGATPHTGVRVIAETDTAAIRAAAASAGVVVMLPVAAAGGLAARFASQPGVRAIELDDLTPTVRAA